MLGSSKSFSRRSCKSSALHLRIVKITIGQTIETFDASLTTDRDEVDSFLVSRLEPDCRSGRNVEAETKRFGSVEFQFGIHFEEVKMRADLNWTISKITDSNACRRKARVDHYALPSETISPWLLTFFASRRPKGLVNANELLAIGKHRFDHQHGQKRHNIRLHVVLV
jgi:hypothetical protein